MIQLQIIGNLAQDAEVKNSNGKDFCVFRLADSRRWTAADGTKHEDTQWCSCIMSRGYENVVQYLRKGVRVFVSGQPSIDIYSSPKDRCMKARYNLQVFSVELVGGQAEAVPRRLVTHDGQLVNVYKAYYVTQNEINFAEVHELYGEKGGSYSVDKLGYVWPQGQNSEQAATVAEENAIAANTGNAETNPNSDAPF